MDTIDFQIEIGDISETVETACYQTDLPIVSRVVDGSEDGAPSDFFSSVAIYPPSIFSSNYLMSVNRTFSFAPQFLTNVSPAAFTGSSRDSSVNANPIYSFLEIWSFSGTLYTQLPGGDGGY